MSGVPLEPGHEILKSEELQLTKLTQELVQVPQELVQPVAQLHHNFIGTSERARHRWQLSG